MKLELKKNYIKFCNSNSKSFTCKWVLMMIYCASEVDAQQVTFHNFLRKLLSHKKRNNFRVHIALSLDSFVVEKSVSEAFAPSSKEGQIFNCVGESKTLQCFGNLRHNSVAPDSFVEVVKVTKKHWTMRYRVRLTLSACYMLDLLQWFEARPRKPRFQAYPTLPDRRSTYNTSLVYCDQLRLHLLHNKCFWLIPWRYMPVRTHKACSWIKLYCTFTCVVDKSHTEWRNTQCVGTLWYYQPQRVPTRTWTASVTWYTRRKLV